MGLLLTVVYLALFLQGSQSTLPKLAALLKVPLWRKPPPCHHTCLQGPENSASGAVSISFRRLGFPQLDWDIHLGRAWVCTEVWLKEYPQALPWLCSSGWWVVVGFFLSPPLILRRSPRIHTKLNRVPLWKAAEREQRRTLALPILSELLLTWECSCFT